VQGDYRIRRVSELTDEHGAWNMGLLLHHFMQADMDEIIKIKPSPRRLDDVLAWALTKNGIFTVKSVYWTTGWHLMIANGLL
jgi:hypothetical protein